MSREHPTASSSSLSSRQSITNKTPSYRMRTLSLSTSSSDDSLDSTISTSTDSSSSTLATRHASTENAFFSSKSIHTHKPTTEHVLIRARNANIPFILRHQKKKTNHAVASRRRHTPDDDSDYEQPHLQNSQRPKKPKTKSQEQLEAEERRMLERKAELADDPLLDASRMCPDRVWCLPCNKYIQIDSRRQFYATLWYKHRGKRHSGVPLKHSEMDNLDMDLAMKEVSFSPTGLETETTMALAVPAIDDALASNILAEMYSKAKGLRLLTLAAAALS